MNIVYIRPPYKDPNKWRDCAATINLGLRAAKGDVIVATHPEVMFGVNSLQAMYDVAMGNSNAPVYVACKPYYLNPAQQEVIDTVPWREQGIPALRQLPNFYGDKMPVVGNPDYSPAAIDAAVTWESWVVGAMTRTWWKWFGGMHESDAWGSIDLSFLGRRQVLSIPTRTLLADDTLCCHQNHDHLPSVRPTPRDMDQAIANTGFWTKENARLNHL